MDVVVATYRQRFRPRPGGGDPWVVLCLPIVIATCDDEADWWFRSVQRRYLDRLRTGGAPMRPPEAAHLDWSASERYRVDAMLDAAIVGSDRTVASRLRDVVGRLAPDEVMAMTDLPDPEATRSSYVRLARTVATLGS
jgi:alkanesulfonate monooxygenase SsuD/methylene tetrahydromethanopterin reductase-like flavin-dependent oxidoreductase (luciferase family)